jgi:hypothetical protein
MTIRTTNQRTGGVKISGLSSSGQFSLDWKAVTRTVMKEKTLSFTVAIDPHYGLRFYIPYGV